MKDNKAKQRLSSNQSTIFNLQITVVLAYFGLASGMRVTSRVVRAYKLCFLAVLPRDV